MVFQFVFTEQKEFQKTESNGNKMPTHICLFNKACNERSVQSNILQIMINSVISKMDIPIVRDLCE